MSNQRNSENPPLAFPPLVVWLLGIGKRPPACPPAAVCMLASVGLFILSIVTVGQNPSLKLLVWWSWGLGVVVMGALVLLQTWLLILHPWPCPTCGQKAMNMPSSEMFRSWWRCGSCPSVQIRFTCRNCGHVADSGIWESSDSGVGGS